MAVDGNNYVLPAGRASWSEPERADIRRDRAAGCRQEEGDGSDRFLTELGSFVQSSLWNQWGNHRAVCVHSVAPAKSVAVSGITWQRNFTPIIIFEEGNDAWTASLSTRAAANRGVSSPPRRLPRFPLGLLWILRIMWPVSYRKRDSERNLNTRA
ncbi:uncharacterized protein [Temnothorax longispinosus]|uniref:uncharacterized protein isoform X2 n=1 Tax=Temnothorax longispinosus TaxID=300112 RepID=UPI003A994A9F